ncbi:MAG: hypothetical protein ACKVOH_04310 [Chlamydiales bacterium]
MRFTLAPQQRKFFHDRGYIAFDDLIDEEDSKKNILTLIQKRQFADFAFELLGKKPLRLDFHKTYPEWPDTIDGFDGDKDCALILSIKSFWGIFIKHTIPRIKDIYSEHEGPFLYILFTSRYLSPERHPIVYK